MNNPNLNREDFEYRGPEPDKGRNKIHELPQNYFAKQWYDKGHIVYLDTECTYDGVVYPIGTYQWTAPNADYTHSGWVMIIDKNGKPITEGTDEGRVNELIDKKLKPYVPEKDFATINGTKITQGGNITISGDGSVITFDDHLDENSKNAVENQAIAKAVNKKANVDGYYPDLRAGQADNLVAGFNVTQNGYVMSVANGKEIEGGLAEVNKFQGSSIVMNQLVNRNEDIEESIDNTLGDRDKFTDELLMAERPVGVISNHLYATRLNFRLIDGEPPKRFYWNRIPIDIPLNGFVISKAKEDSPNAVSLLSQVSKGEKSHFKIRPILIDLTKMFGAGNEPQSAEAFEAMFPQPYYDYNEGTIVNYNAEGFKIVGTNIWDEQWESTGGGVRSVNPINIKPKTTYYVTTPKRIVLSLQDVNGVELRRVPLKDTTFTTNENEFLMTLQTIGSENYGGVYNHDICINVSSPSVDGKYFPYKEDTVNFNIQDIKGPDGLPLFPNGLQSSGEVHDEVYPTYAIKRVDRVDLGTLDWQPYSSNYPSIWLTKNQPLNMIKSKKPVLCSKYINSEGAREDLTIVANSGRYFGENWRPYLAINSKEFEGKSTSEIVSILQGVILNYELAEPIRVDFPTPLRNTFQVENQGTIYQIPEQANGLVTSTATIAEIRYYMNASGIIENLPQGYISKKSMDNLLGQLSQAMGGTWSMVYNPITESYDFKFVKNPPAEEPINTIQS